MVLEKILTADNVVVAINQNIDMLLEEVPELKYVINYKRRGREKLDLWSLTLLSLYNSFNDLSVRMTLLFKNLGIVLMNDMNKIVMRLLLSLLLIYLRDVNIMMILLMRFLFWLEIAIER